MVWMGFSLGGLASARAALRADRRRADRDSGVGSGRESYRNSVVAFSGAFKGVPEDPNPYDSERSWLHERLRETEGGLPHDWYLEVGSLEWLLEVNRRVAGSLSEHGANVVLRERSAGHNWTSWRNGLPDALRFALGRRVAQ